MAVFLPIPRFNQGQVENFIRQVERGRRPMIRFSYPESVHPNHLHRQFLKAGASPRLYTYRPRTGHWSLCISDLTEADVIREVFESLDISYDERVVASRFK
jgi:hypothetical protein